MQLTKTGPRPAYTARDYNTIMTDLQAYISATRPDLLPDFQNNQGLGPFLLSLVALVGDITSYSLDAAALALYLDTTLQLAAALRFARSIGYVPASANNATVTVTCTSVPSNLYASGGIITGGQTVVGPNGTNFFVGNDVTVAVHATTISFSMLEGIQYTETVDPANMPYFTYTTQNYISVLGSLVVTVGGTPWTSVNNVYNESTASNTYEVTFDDFWRLVIKFGNGVNGAIPTQSIVFTYRTTTGSAGNLPAGSLSFALKAAVTGGGTATLNFTSAAGSGGQDPETLESLRNSIPAYIQGPQWGRLVTMADFNSYLALPTLRGQGVVGWASMSFASYSANIVNINSWSVSPATFISEGTSPPNSSSATYVGYQQITNSGIATLSSNLMSLMPITMFPAILQSPIACVDIYTNSIVYDPTYLSSTVHANLTTAVANLFSNPNSLFVVTQASLLSAMQSVAGVISATIDRIVFQYYGYPQATGSIGFTGGANPAANDTVSISDSLSNTVVFQFASSLPVATGNVYVNINASPVLTMVNLINAINNSGLLVQAVVDPSNPEQALLTAINGGPAYNLPLAHTGSVIYISGMSGGALGSPSLQSKDMRRIVNPGGNDSWPVTGATYTPGPPWIDVGIAPYYPLDDVVINVAANQKNYYAQAYVYNHEIIYNPTNEVSVVPQALTLRRLVMNLKSA